MTPSEQCKQAGLKSLAELSRISGIPTRTLQNWHTQRPRAFEVMLCGARVKQRIAELQDSDKFSDKLRLINLQEHDCFTTD